jgi:nicotinate-nucleotide pyrophosphorylase (carboxylating)
MSLEAQPPTTAVREAVERALAEDLTPLGDLTAALVPAGAVARGALVARVDGVLAGTACVTETFGQVDPEVEVGWLVGDGRRVGPGDELATISGPLRSVLIAERTALNFLGHLSGIATLTDRFVQTAAATGSPTRVWDTRKTTPGLRSLEKAAVRAGGGANHRGNLSEWVMLKDNHLAAIGIAEGVSRARELWPGRTVHVECDTLDQVDEALRVGADAVLLDNMAPDEVRDAVGRRDESGTRCLLEASGGITLHTVADYARTGVDLISTGAITNSAEVLDIGLDLEGPGS